MEALFIVTDAHIRGLIDTHFSGHGGGSKLARALSVGPTTACALRKGKGSLTKAAAYFGYVAVPEQPGFWRQAAADVRPSIAGYIRWTPKTLGELRRRLAAGESVVDLARHFGKSTRRLREIILEHRLRDAPSYEVQIAEAHLAGDEDLKHRIRVEMKARASGGSLSQQTASMQRSLMSDDERREFNADLRRLIDAAA